MKLGLFLLLLLLLHCTLQKCVMVVNNVLLLIEVIVDKHSHLFEFLIFLQSVNLIIGIASNYCTLLSLKEVQISVSCCLVCCR